MSGPGPVGIEGPLAVSALLFGAGLLAVLTRRHAIFVLIGIELMLAAANLNFVLFAGRGRAAADADGLLMALFAIAVAAAEAAVGLALVIAVYRHVRAPEVDRVDALRG